MQPPRPTQPPTLRGDVCGWGVKAGMAHSARAGCRKKLCNPSLTRAIPELFTGDILSIRRYTNVMFTYCTRRFDFAD